METEVKLCFDEFLKFSLKLCPFSSLISPCFNDRHSVLYKSPSLLIGLNKFLLFEFSK